MGPQRMFGMTPWVRRLLVANLVVLLLQMTIFVNPRFLYAFGFVPLRALAQPWTFVTYMFLHTGPLHLAVNLLALFVFGSAVEERMGSGPFLGYYLLCGLGGAALSYLLMQLRPVDVVVGASAAVYGVMLAFAWAWPDQPIYVFLLPGPIPAKWLVTFVAAISRTWAASPPVSSTSSSGTCGSPGRSATCGASPSRRCWCIRAAWRAAATPSRSRAAPSATWRRPRSTACSTRSRRAGSRASPRRSGSS